MTSPAPYILALDIASQTGCCEGRVGETPRFSTMRFARKDDEHEDVFLRALDWFDEKLSVSKPDWVYVEAPVNPAAFLGEYDPSKGRVTMTSNPDTTIRLIGLWAVIAATAKLQQIPYRRAHVSTARKAFLGVGNLRGQEAKRRAFDLCLALGWSPNSRDASDAASVWYYASTIVAPKLTMPISPMLQKQIATTIGGVEIDDAESFFKKARGGGR